MEAPERYTRTERPSMEQLVTSARVVSRSWPQITALPHVRELLASFLAPADSWMIERAIRSGYQRLAACMVEKFASNTERHELDKRAYVRQCVVPLAAERGDVALLELLSARFDFCVDEYAVSAAARGGHLEALQWLVDRALCVVPVGEDVQAFTKQIFSTVVVSGAASSGHLEVLQWIDERVGGLSSHIRGSALFHACLRGHMRIVEWVQPKVAVPLHALSTWHIVTQGHAEVIRFLHSKSMLQLTHRVMNLAAGRGPLDLLQWMIDSGGEGFTPLAMEMAASNGRVDTIRWLRSKHVRCTPAVVPAAVREGHLEALKFLADHYPRRITLATFDEAVRCNHLHVVQYLFDRRHGICVNASGDDVASKGHLEMIKWLEIHCPDTAFTTFAMDSAASHGHLDVVKYLHENRTEGCTTKAMDGASKNGHLDVVEWLHSHRSEGCTTEAMDAAAAGGHLEVVKFLHENRTEGCTTEAMNKAAAEGHLAVVKFLHENRTEGCTTAAMDTIGRSVFGYARRRLKLLRLLVGNSCESFTARALENAASKGDVGMLEWFDGRASGDMWTSAVAIKAAQTGSIEALEWLAEHHPETIVAYTLKHDCARHWWLDSWLKRKTEL